MLHWRAVPPAEWHGPDLAYLGKKKENHFIGFKKLFINHTKKVGSALSKVPSKFSIKRNF